jgi:hypothetical protein
MPLAEIDQTGVSPNHSNRNGSRVRLFVLHTQEGGGSAQSLANYLQNANSGVSYHYTCDDRSLIAVVDTDRYSWSVLDANPYTINFCFAGSRAAQSREVWLRDFGNAIDTAAFIFVRDARQYKFNNIQTLSWAQIGAGKMGATDHRGITEGLGIGDHTDVGPNFPWDVFGAAVTKYRDGAPAVVVPAGPVVNQINKKRDESPWLGKDLSGEEKTTPDGKGKYRHYENGSIYWTPGTGAHPVPLSLRGYWEKKGWEKSKLGYPINDHKVLNGPDGKPWGDVQGFQLGAIYRKYGGDAHWVNGEIGNRWFRSGFENGKLGWPTSDEVTIDGAIYQDFENGRIYFPTKGNTVAFLSAPGTDLPLPDTLK